MSVITNFIERINLSLLLIERGCKRISGIDDDVGVSILTEKLSNLEICLLILKKNIQKNWENSNPKSKIWDMKILETQENISRLKNNLSNSKTTLL